MHGDRRGRGHPGAGRVTAPRRLVEVLGHAVGVLGRAALGGGVAGARNRAGDMEQHQPQRPPGGRVGQIARAEGAEARVVAPGAGSLAVHHQQGRDRMGGGVDAPQVHLRAGQGPHCGHEHAQMFRPAPGQHRVHRDDPDRRHSGPRRQHRDDLVAVAVASRQHRVDPLGGGCHHRQAVAPAAGPVAVQQGLRVIRGDVEELGQGVGHRLQSAALGAVCGRGRARRPGVAVPKAVLICNFTA